MVSWNNAVDGPFEEAFANACLSREEIESNSSTSSTYEVRKLLVEILRAWTRLDKGGVIVANQSGSVFQGIEFCDLHKPVAVEIQYCVGKNRRDAEAFLRGEDILLITCSDTTAAALRAHLRESLSSSGNVDLGSGLLLQEGLIKPIAPPLEHHSTVASSGAENTSNTTSPCLNCSKPCTLRCAQCMVVSFCNRECQKQAWKAHKAFCKAVANPTKSSKENPSRTSSTNTCLIVDGMGPCGANWDCMKRAREELLDAGVHVCVINGEKGRKLPEQVASLLSWNESKEATFRSIFMPGFGSGDDYLSPAFSNSRLFREVSVSWVQKGGNFLVQGERIAQCGNWPEWFGKVWKDGGYYRTDHTCFARPSAGGGNGEEIVHWCKWYHQASGAITSDINVKATMLSNVPADEILFGTDVGARTYSLVPDMAGQSIGEGMTAVALGKCGQGTVSFFGDVNHEDETVRTIAIVARGH